MDKSSKEVEVKMADYLDPNLAHLPDPGKIIRISCKQCLTVSTPGKGEALWWLSSCRSRHLGSEFLHQILALQVPHLDGRASCRAQPVPVGGEGEGVDGVSVVEGVQMLAVVEVPQHGLSVLAT